jgi:alpha-L-arabinofuranosidase
MVLGICTRSFGAAPASGQPEVLMAGDEYRGVALEAIKHSESNLVSSKVVVKESRVINRPDRGMLGYNQNWFHNNSYMTEYTNGQIVLNAECMEILKGLPFPMNRLAGTESQLFNWKKAIGSYNERQPQKLVGWAAPEVATTGPIEWLNAMKQLDPSFRVVWVVNMISETAEDNADLVEFLTGDGKSNPNDGVNWGLRRIELGYPDPVPVLIEMGNELDWGSARARYPVDVYIKECRERMAAMRAVCPDLQFAAHASTAPWSKKHAETGGWRTWHLKVLKELGDEIDYVAIHPYYCGLPVAVVEQQYMKVLMNDIKSVAGSDRIKIYASEHARWPRSLANEDRYQTHSLQGMLATGEWINRMLQYSQVKYMSYHCLSGGPWGLVYKGAHGFYRTAMADFFNVYNAGFGDVVYFSEVEGPDSDPANKTLKFTVNAMGAVDELRLFIVNRDEVSARELTFSFEEDYTLIKEVVMTGSHPDAVNNETKKEVVTDSKAYADGASFNSCIVPSKSMTVLYLKKR